MREHDGPREPTIKEEIFGVLDVWANEHASRSEGQLVAYAPSDPNYPTEMRTHIRGNPLDHTLVDRLARGAEKKYPALRAGVKSAEAERQEVTRMMELLKNGNNVALVFDHEHLINLALGQAAVYSEMDELGRPDNLETAIVINTMVERLGVLFQEGEEDESVYSPAIDALSIGEDHIFLSYPKTPTARQRYEGPRDAARQKLINATINAHNQIMRAGIRRQLHRGGTLFAISPSGGVDRPDNPQNPTHITMARANAATARLITRSDTYVMPVALSYVGNWEPYLIFPSTPQVLSSPSDLHDAMNLIAEVKTQETPGVTYEYQAAE